MPTDHIIALLIAERDKMNLAIEALQGSTKGRGRPLNTVETPGASVPNFAHPDNARTSPSPLRMQESHITLDGEASISMWSRNPAILAVRTNRRCALKGADSAQIALDIPNLGWYK